MGSRLGSVIHSRVHTFMLDISNYTIVLIGVECHLVKKIIRSRILRQIK